MIVSFLSSGAPNKLGSGPLKRAPIGQLLLHRCAFEQLLRSLLLDTRDRDSFFIHGLNSKLVKTCTLVIFVFCFFAADLHCQCKVKKRGSWQRTSSNRQHGYRHPGDSSDVRATFLAERLLICQYFPLHHLKQKCPSESYHPAAHRTYEIPNVTFGINVLAGSWLPTFSIQSKIHLWFMSLSHIQSIIKVMYMQSDNSTLIGPQRKNIMDLCCIKWHIFALDSCLSSVSKYPPCSHSSPGMLLYFTTTK